MGFSIQIDATLAAPSPEMRAFRKLLEPCSDRALEEMARRSSSLTRRHFGRTMRMFAPLYLSNECINSCAYCGFSRDNAILRVTLEIDRWLPRRGIWPGKDFAISCWLQGSIRSLFRGAIFNAAWSV